MAVVAVAVIGWEHRAHRAPGSVDLAILGTVWLLALVVLSPGPGVDSGARWPSSPCTPRCSSGPGG